MKLGGDLLALCENNGPEEIEKVVTTVTSFLHIGVIQSNLRKDLPGSSPYFLHRSP